MKSISGSFSRKPGFINQAQVQKVILTPNVINSKSFTTSKSILGKTKQSIRKKEIIIIVRKAISVLEDLTDFFTGVFIIKQSPKKEL
jgi:hypothetical protein